MKWEFVENKHEKPAGIIQIFCQSCIPETSETPLFLTITK
jgi:hypothetical protein